MISFMNVSQWISALNPFVTAFEFKKLQNSMQTSIDTGIITLFDILLFLLQTDTSSLYLL